MTLTACDLSDYRLSHLPKKMGVVEVLYSSEESWGIGGPGDNETGFIIYAMPDLMAEQLEDRGLLYLRSIAAGQAWRATPVIFDDEWARSQFGETEQGTSIYDFMDKYGFSIPVDAPMASLIDKATHETGAFYAYGRGGAVTILIPAEHKIAFVYAG